MINLKIDIKKTIGIITQNEIDAYQSIISQHHSDLINKKGKGNDFLGWVDLPSSISNDQLDEINKSAEIISNNSDLIVVVGIGGSYLGAKAVIDALNNQFAALSNNQKKPFVIYAGNNISEDYHFELLELLNNKDYSIVVISKSGTTTEPALAFRLLKNHIENKYGKEAANQRIVAVTDFSRGALKQLATTENYKTFGIPDDVGGRYSVLTPVGLLPIAAAGFDIKKIVEGARKMETTLKASSKIEENPAVLYSVVRNLLYQKGKKIEILANFQPYLQYFTEWWKQLYGESEGKESKGIFPAGVNFSTDLHSMGQYVQDGLRIIFETVLSVENSKNSLKVPFDENDLDGLNFLAGRNIQEINEKAEAGTMLAHVDGNVPNIKITIPKLDEENLGELIYFFEFACALSGYVLDVNPFDQPGVEAYKANMFALLGKPGFEKQKEELDKRLKN
ncbi:MAG: glucose-6-phosphate isomerase [Bacteroidetes bacterium]|nr:glucose-6-phosphate isomerase [Bacteroidota bacterium]